MSGDCTLFCVDNSESAFLSEDFPGSRWWYQRQATNSLCAHYALQNGNRTDEAHITTRQTRASKGRMCIIAAGDAKLHHPPSDLQGCDVAQASLFSLQMAEGQKSQYSSALRLAALVAKRHASAHIIAFVAGPCGFSQGDVPGLASRLEGTRLDVVMLAPAAEVGSSTMQALQFLVDCLNGDAAGLAISESLAPKGSAPAADSGRQSSSVSAAADSAQSPSGGLEACGHASCANGSALIRWQEPEAAETRAGRASRLLFIQPPQEGMEVWQQLEPFMEMLEASETPSNHQESGPPAEAEAHTLIPGGSPNSDQPPAAEVLSLASPTPAPAANTTHLWQQEQQQWHRGRALLARRSGVLTPALCRNESLDLLHHLSSDGFSRPWLPNYANLPQRAAAALQQQQQQSAPCRVQVLRLDVPQWQVLIEVPAGRMLGPNQGSSSSQRLDASNGSILDTLTAAQFAAPSTFAEQCWQPWGIPSPSPTASVIPVAAPISSPFEVPVIHARKAAAPRVASHTPPRPRTASRKGQSPGRGQLPGQGSSPRERAARARASSRPVRLEPDARMGKLLLLLSVDDRHKLKLVWTHEPAGQGAPGSGASSRSTAYPSLWERPAPSAPQPLGFPYQSGSQAALPGAELAISLDPQAVALSSAHGGRVLVVEQRLSAQKSRHHGHNEGIIGLMPDGHQVERWFFWLQQPDSVPAQMSTSDSPDQAAETGANSGDASDVAARLQALMTDPPQIGARNAFRRAMQRSEDESKGDVFVSIKADTSVECVTSGHPFSFMGQADNLPMAASASIPIGGIGKDMQGERRRAEQPIRIIANDNTERQQPDTAVHVHHAERASHESCEDGSTCRDHEGDPDRCLQQGLMSGGGPLLPAVDSGKDATPEDSVLFELD